MSWAVANKWLNAGLRTEDVVCEARCGNLDLNFTAEVVRDIKRLHAAHGQSHTHYLVANYSNSNFTTCKLVSLW